MEVVRGAYDLFAKGQIGAAFGRYLHPDAELTTPPIYPEGEQTYRGQRGLERWARMVEEVWGEWRFEVESVAPAGENTVLALARIVAEGGTSGVRVEREVAHVWTLEDGLAKSVRVYLDRAEGAAAAASAE